MCMKCFLECQKCVIKVSMYCECGWFMCDQVYCVWSGVLWVCKICMTKCAVCVQDVCVWSSVLCEKSLIILTMPSNFQGSYVVISQMWMLNSQQMEASSTSVSSYMSVCGSCPKETRHLLQLCSTYSRSRLQWMQSNTASADYILPKTGEKCQEPETNHHFQWSNSHGGLSAGVE